MLVPVAEGPAIVVCRTCRAPGHGGGIADGARLAAALMQARAADPACAGIAIQPMPCLFACGRSVTVHLRAPGRIGYLLGGLTADDAAARALLDYAVRHAASDDGVVPFADWPEGIKGRFIARIPPPGFVAEDER